jgi:hypothetical protein
MKSFKDYLISENLAKKKKYSVVRYDAPNSGKVTHSTVIHATNKAELHGHVRNWMDKIGLDPDDEDDHSHINITSAK